MIGLIVRARGIAASSELLDTVAGRVDADTLEDLVPGVLEVQEDWWSSLGRGTWDGHDLEETGRLRALATREGAGQRVEVNGDELVFGLGSGGPDDPATYGAALAARGWSPIVDPDDADAEQLAEDYLEAVLDDA